MERPVLHTFQQRYGVDSIRVTKNHAKIATVVGNDQAYCIRGSMNLNSNPRMEQVDISEGDGAADLTLAVIAEIWERSAPLPIKDLENMHAADLFAQTGPKPSAGWMDELKTLHI